MVQETLRSMFSEVWIEMVGMKKKWLDSLYLKVVKYTFWTIKTCFYRHAIFDTDLPRVMGSFYSLVEVLDFGQTQACLSFHFSGCKPGQILMNGFIVLTLTIPILNFLPVRIKFEPNFRYN